MRGDMCFEQEVEHRFAVWLENLEYVVQHNEREGTSYWVRGHLLFHPHVFARSMLM
jgi:hypothetical protein